MKNYEIKNTGDVQQGGVLDVDGTSRKVKVVLNRTGIKDHDSDIIEKSAFNKTIKERGPAGKGLIWHLTDHRPSIKDGAIARFSELTMEGDDLVGVTDIPNTTWGNDILEFYKTGNINQHSIGFTTIKREVVNEDDYTKRYTIIKEVMLYEGSAVLWGANELTPTLTVGKSLTKEQVIDEYAKTIEEINKINGLFAKANLSDETFELLQIKHVQLTDKLQQLFDRATTPATQPDAKSVEPVTEGLLGVLTTFTNQLKTANDDRSRKATAAA